MLLIIWENCWWENWNNTVIVIWNYFYSVISKFFCNNIATILISVEKNIMKEHFKLLLKPSPSLCGWKLGGYFITVLLFKNKWWKVWHWGNAADRLEPCLPYILISMNTWKWKIILAKYFMIYHMKSSAGSKVMHLRNKPKKHYCVDLNLYVACRKYLMHNWNSLSPAVNFACLFSGSINQF